MRTRTIIIDLSILLALALLAVSASTTSACTPEDETLRCGFTRPNKAKTATAIARADVKPTPKPAPVAAVKKGGGPADAMDPTDVWDTIQPGATLWYKMDRPQNSRMTIWLDANGRDGVQLSIYSPDQINDLGSVAPKGRATPNKLDARHDVWWVGQSPSGGTWYAVVQNVTSTPMAYKVGTDQLYTGPKQCQSYWEQLFGAPFWWTACN